MLLVVLLLVAVCLLPYILAVYWKRWPASPWLLLSVFLSFPIGSYQLYRLREVHGIVSPMGGTKLGVVGFSVVLSSLVVITIVSILPKRKNPPTSKETITIFYWVIASLFLVTVLSKAAVKLYTDKKLQYMLEHIDCKTIRDEAYEVAVDVEMNRLYVERPIDTLEKERKYSIAKHKQNLYAASPTKFANQLEHECTNNEGWWSYRK